MKNIVCYTDGSSRGNPGPGGWGAIVVIGSDVIEKGGREDTTTNNRMELRAIIGALQAIGATDNAISVYTDSTYAVKGITSWIRGWKSNDWKTQTKTDVSNKDLWQELDALVQDKKVEWCIVKGHAGIAANERVDEIATEFADKKEVHLFKGNVRDYDVDVIPPTKEQLENAKSNDRRKAKAYSYLSLVDGVFMRHETWAACEARVKGKSGVKFKKAISKADEESIMADWGII